MNLEVAPAIKELIIVTQESIHADSMSEVIRRAVLLLDHVNTAQSEGSQILVRRKDGSEYLMFVF